MATIRFEISGGTIEEITDTMQTMVPYKTAHDILAGMSLEELLLYTDERCQQMGYDMVVSQEKPAAEKAKGATAKLKTDLEASIRAMETSAQSEPKKTNGRSIETDDQRKERCVAKLQALFAEGHKDQVRALLKQYGDGAKNFHGVPVERFAEISQAIEELKL